MNDIFAILDILDAENSAAYEAVMAYCDTRVTADEGIPAIIALDDLTKDAAADFIPATDDEGMGLVLAAEALLYTNLYEQRPQKPDDKYPAICPAMSAAAESCFRAEKPAEGKLHLIPYADVVGEFIKKDDK